MKILLVAKQFGHFRHMEAVAESLLAARHQIEWRFGDNEKADITDRSVRAFNLKYHLDDYQKIPNPRGMFYSLSRFLQAILGYRVYLKPGWTSHKYKVNYLHRVHKVARALLTLPHVEKIISTQWFFAGVRRAMRLIPPSTRVLKDLQASSPHVVMVTTNLPWDAHEMEYLKAAAFLGIPAAVQIASWDNLTTKNTLTAVPDKVFVWNDALKEEAEILHGIPGKNIVVTGAATFDYLFAFRKTQTYEQFCRQAGLVENKPFILYLGSSNSIAGDETAFARGFVRRVCESLDVQVLIRPHPVNYKPWSAFDERGSVVWPRVGDLPDTASTKQVFLETLYHSAAVVGINTSAMIEAAVLDKPCLSIKPRQYNFLQSDESHFRHLVNGQFLELAEDEDSAAGLLKQILKGEDRLKDNRRNFVYNFIRPNGLERPVGAFIAEMLVSMSA